MRTLWPILQALDDLGQPTAVLLLDYFHKRSAGRFSGLRHCRVVALSALGRPGPFAVASSLRKARRAMRRFMQSPSELLRTTASRHPNYVLEVLAQQALWERMARKLFATNWSSAFVALGFHSGFARAALVAARDVGVPTVSVPHAALFWKTEDLLPPYHADHYLSWSHHWDAMLASAVEAGSKIHHTGFARYDVELPAGQASGPPSPASVLILSDNAALVNLGEGPARRYHKELGRVVQQLRERHEVILRLHPGAVGENKILRECWGNDLLGRLVIPGADVSLRDLLRRRPVVVGGMTTALLEAMAFGCPVVQNSPIPVPAIFDLRRHGCQGVDRPAQLPLFVNGWMDQPGKLVELLKQQYRFLDLTLANRGSAAEACAKVLMAVQRV